MYRTLSFSSPGTSLAMSPSERSRTHISEQAISGYNSLGKPAGKNSWDKPGFFALVLSSLCLLAGCVAVSSLTDVPWRLGFKRQLQVVGILLSVMNQCLLVVTPKFFLIVEARFGKSVLQNYDMILRHSSFLAHTNVAWRVMLMVPWLPPIGLCLVYKEF